ncbi:MAG: DUF2953 domain-containing protein [Clostridia bacterium]|nr:DUF2953 domain-containing protein [Clostridia bacterium]
MLPYAALALALFGVLWWMPVRADGRFDFNRVPTLHLNCFIWKFRLAYDAVVERREGGLALSIRKRGSKSKPDEGFEATVKEIRDAVFFLRDHPRCAKSLRRCLRLRGMSVSMRVGAGDAALTAMLYGVCCAALQFLARRIFVASRVRPTVNVRDDRDAAFLCSVRCIIEFHVGNIMGAAIWLALESVAGKVGSVWSGIQSKA